MTGDYAIWQAIKLHDLWLCYMIGDLAITQYGWRLRYMTCDYSTGYYATWLVITLHHWRLRYIDERFTPYGRWRRKYYKTFELWTTYDKRTVGAKLKKGLVICAPNKQFAFLHFWRVYFSKAVRSLIPSSAVFSPVCSISHWKKENKRQKCTL
jgi:hypothetical protein